MFLNKEIRTEFTYRLQNPTIKNDYPVVKLNSALQIIYLIYRWHGMTCKEI